MTHAEPTLVLDPEVASQLMGASRQQDSLARLTPREREVLELMAPKGCPTTPSPWP